MDEAEIIKRIGQGDKRAMQALCGNWKMFFRERGAPASKVCYAQ